VVAAGPSGGRRWVGDGSRAARGRRSATAARHGSAREAWESGWHAHGGADGELSSFV